MLYWLGIKCQRDVYFSKYLLFRLLNKIADEYPFAALNLHLLYIFSLLQFARFFHSYSISLTTISMDFIILPLIKNVPSQWQFHIENLCYRIPITQNSRNISFAHLLLLYKYLCSTITVKKDVKINVPNITEISSNYWDVKLS